MEGFGDASAMLGPGVYVLRFRGEVVYVGKSRTLCTRIYAHRNAWRYRNRRTPPGLRNVKVIQFDEVWVQAVPIMELDRVERELIAKYYPKHNVAMNPGGPPKEIKLAVGSCVVTLMARKQPELRRI